MGPGVLRLKRDREARARTHPWIFKGDVADVTTPHPLGKYDPQTIAYHVERKHKEHQGDARYERKYWKIQ